MKRKYIPLILMLAAGAVAGIIACVKGYSLVGMLTAVLIAFVVFYFIGSCFKALLDLFDKQNAEREKAAEEQEKEEQQAAKEQEKEEKKHT